MSRIRIRTSRVLAATLIAVFAVGAAAPAATASGHSDAKRAILRAIL